MWVKWPATGRDRWKLQAANCETKQGRSQEARQCTVIVTVTMKEGGQRRLVLGGCAILKRVKHEAQDRTEQDKTRRDERHVNKVDRQTNRQTGSDPRQGKVSGDTSRKKRRDKKRARQTEGRWNGLDN